MTEKRYNIGDKEARAFLRMTKGSAQKVNLVAESIRGLSASAALAQLTVSKKRASEDVRKLLLSAIANATNNYRLDVDKLFVKEAYVGRAMTLKRFHARARGRGAAILKPFSNMTLIVAEKEVEKKPVEKKKTEAAPKPKAKAGAKKAEAK